MRDVLPVRCVCIPRVRATIFDFLAAFNGRRGLVGDEYSLEVLQLSSAMRLKHFR
jgi:hypothetical protein